MAYNPPTQSIVDNDTRNTASNEAIYEALKLKADTNLQNLSFSGNNGDVITLSGGIPVWAAPAGGGMTNPMTNAGEIIYGGVAGAPQALAAGTSEYVLTSNATTVEWRVVGTGSSGAAYPTNSLILGKVKPAGFTSQQSIILGTGTTGDLSTGLNNILIGYNTAAALATGAGSIAIGSSSVIGAAVSNAIAIGTSADVSGASGVAIGASSATGSGANNVVLGNAAGRSAASGANNILLGNAAGDALTTGASNICLGQNAGGALTAASNTVLIGNNAGLLMSTANHNNTIAIGTDALKTISSVNSMEGIVAIGYQALTAATTIFNSPGSGQYSAVAIGTQAAYQTTSATNMIAIGGQACKGTHAKGDAIAIGGNTGGSAATVAIGSSALAAITGTGSATVAIGDQGLISQTSGIGNTAIGYRVGTVTLTNFNGVATTTGSSNIFLGLGATGLANSTSSSIAIGINAVAGSNECAIGGYNTNATYGSAGAISTVLLGRGGVSIPAVAAQAVTVMTQRATGTDIDISAGSLTLAGSRSTGNKAGSSVFLATAPAGASGTTLNAHVNRLEVTAPGDVKVLTGQLTVETAGKGLSIKEGSNAKMGTATMTAGTVTVSTTAVTANSRIFLSIQSLGTVASPKAIAVTARVAGTSFTITSEDNTDTSVVAWMLVEPA